MGVEVIARLFRNRAVCACGWQSESHFFRGGAVLDGGLHLSTHSYAADTPPVHVQQAS